MSRAWEHTRTARDPRAEVTLATQIPQAKCRQINLATAPATINPGDYANREDEGVLLVPHAGERLYRLANPPGWAYAWLINREEFNFTVQASTRLQQSAVLVADLVFQNSEPCPGMIHEHGCSHDSLVSSWALPSRLPQRLHGWANAIDNRTQVGEDFPWVFQFLIVANTAPQPHGPSPRPSGCQTARRRTRYSNL
ncbi:MAG: hypothetical protein CM1200mP29_09750 [Verrucomicrobiota bacterium]|nr:MAG: hypothetical protein CM1200mP29_09750 [Verrucomicrobiota bacterium]